MDPVDEEVVALYDDEGRPDGSVPRSVMRAQNLRHAATGVLVRDPYGRIYVHRRTPTKDVYPGYWDFAAGGVVLDGEDPLAAARRELAEELGVESELEPLGEADYADDSTRYHAFRYVTTWDGPITPQPEEVAYGAWLSIERLLERLADPEVLFMPDTRALFSDWLHHRAAEHGEAYHGRQVVVTVVEDCWLDRVPRVRATEARLVQETRLLSRLAPLLPLEVPAPIVLDESPLRVRHRLLAGPTATTDALTADDGVRLGELLRTLHDLPESFYSETGVPDRVAARATLLVELERMFHLVLPRLSDRLQSHGLDLLRRIALPGPAVLVHGDLAARHLVTSDGCVSGVLDWTAARAADPARDLAWPLYGTPSPVAEAVATTYAVSDDELHRALDWHRLAPWYDALWELKNGDDASVAAALDQVAVRIDVAE
jgi:8-oxo-dGTP pyrophosphatase MutT (NUDIX family)/aminoglycoside phosphotransferase (APT) family kinase protein